MTTENTRIDATVHETTVRGNHEADDSSDYTDLEKFGQDSEFISMPMKKAFDPHG